MLYRVRSLFYPGGIYPIRIEEFGVAYHNRFRWGAGENAWELWGPLQDVGSTALMESVLDLEKPSGSKSWFLNSFFIPKCLNENGKPFHFILLDAVCGIVLLVYEPCAWEGAHTCMCDVHSCYVLLTKMTSVHTHMCVHHSRCLDKFTHTSQPSFSRDFHSS